MSFTDITNGSNCWQRASVVNEYVISYNEREAFIYQPNMIPEIESGDCIQQASLWEKIQRSLAVSSFFAKPFSEIASIPFIYDDGGWQEELFYTRQELYDLAGMPYGYRRSTDGGQNFSYGYMERGDCFGSWIFEDLQKMFSVTTRARFGNHEKEMDGTTCAGQSTNCEGLGINYSCAPAVNASSGTADIYWVHPPAGFLSVSASGYYGMAPHISVTDHSMPIGSVMHSFSVASGAAGSFDPLQSGLAENVPVRTETALPQETVGTVKYPTGETYTSSTIGRCSEGTSFGHTLNMLGPVIGTWTQSY